MDYLIKADGMGDVYSHDPKHAIKRVDELRYRGWKNVRITDVNNRPVDEAALRKMAGES
jgi:uridylate kinase